MATTLARSVIFPDRPRAAFVDDATIPFQHERGDPDALTDYCDHAEAAVLNAFESDELGTEDPVSRRDREVIATLRAWTDRVVRVGDDDVDEGWTSPERRPVGALRA